MKYVLSPDGIYRPDVPIQHRNEEYDQSGFEILCAMQEQHFGYRGRHRFLLASVERLLLNDTAPLNALDLGGGVGGWIRYLADRRGKHFSDLALADSSEKALYMAGAILPAGVERFQIDLMNLGWQNHWNCCFLLDVIEHLPDDVNAIRQAAQALKPGGYLFVTAPALRKFWSYNDELALHLRRYDLGDFVRLAEASSLELCDARYFMFLLSPLYWLARNWKNTQGMSDEEKVVHMIKTHKVPSHPINWALGVVFAAETPLGHFLRFPWGTSILGVFRKS